LEQEIYKLSKQLEEEERKIEMLENKNIQASDAINKLKEIGEDLKNQEAYKKYAYVIKDDLINVYNKSQELKRQQSILENDSDLKNDYKEQ
jgi:predicted RNase H-like nuclease (RuvC/YqgF family)